MTGVQTCALPISRTPPTTVRKIESGVGLEISGRREIQRSLRRTSEQTRIGSDPASTIKRFVFSNLRQEKDRGSLLVGNIVVDTLRTQLDVYGKGSYALKAGTNHEISAELDIVYGQENRAVININNNTFSNYAKDGFKITFEDYPVVDEFEIGRAHV